MDIEKQRSYLACYLVLIKDDQILLLKRANTGYEDGNYSMVAGHIDGGETAIGTMKREAKEEAGIEINPDDMKIVHIMHRNAPDRNYIDFFIVANKWTGEIKNLEPQKCDDLSWFYLSKLPNNVIPYVKKAIENINSKEIYSEYGFE